jgi:hypothetical protein
MGKVEISPIQEELASRRPVHHIFKRAEGAFSEVVETARRVQEVERKEITVERLIEPGAGGFGTL